MNRDLTLWQRLMAPKPRFFKRLLIGANAVGIILYAGTNGWLIGQLQTDQASPWLVPVQLGIAWLLTGINLTALLTVDREALRKEQQLDNIR